MISKDISCYQIIIDPKCTKEDQLIMWPSEDQNNFIYRIVEDIKNARLSPRGIDVKTRQRCIEVLISQGFSKRKIAQLLERSEKTIKRDVDQIHLKHSLDPDKWLIKMIVGQLTMSAELHCQNLINLAKNASLVESARIEYLIFKIQAERITKLQSLGCLPIKVYISPNIEDRFNKLVENIKRELKQIEELTNKFKDDILNSINEGRFPLILTERREHLEKLAKLLQDKIEFLVILHGGIKQKDRRVIFERIKECPDDCPKTILATGSYIGEDFDEPRLNTLFLTMPSSFKGRIVQYAGRLHRYHKDKNNVRIYDYVDKGIPMLERMFQRRLKTYKILGYEIGDGVVVKQSDSDLFSDNTA